MLKVAIKDKNLVFSKYNIHKILFLINNIEFMIETVNCLHVYSIMKHLPRYLYIFKGAQTHVRSHSISTKIFPTPESKAILHLRRPICQFVRLYK